MINWQEKAFEDWLCSDDETGTWRIRAAMRGIDQSVAVGYITRQVDIGIGRIDVLALSTHGISVLELKAHEANGEDLTQLLEYCQWISERLTQHTELPIPARDFIRPYLVAPCFTDRVKSAAQWCDARVVQVSVSWSLQLDWSDRATDDASEREPKRIDTLLGQVTDQFIDEYGQRDIPIPEVAQNGEAQEPGRGLLDEPDNETVPVALQGAIGGANNEDS